MPFGVPADPGSRTPGVLLESSWGALGELLDPPGCLLGGSCSLGAVLEASWEVLGRSWAEKIL